jgi:hypothetical protein
MDEPPTSTPGKLRKEQIRWFRDNLEFFKNVFRFLRILIYVFAAVWSGGVIWMAITAIHDMVSSGQPLVINDARSTWVGSVGFVALILSIGVFGVACMLWGLHLFRRSLALHEVQKKEGGIHVA